MTIQEDLWGIYLQSEKRVGERALFDFYYEKVAKKAAYKVYKKLQHKSILFELEDFNQSAALGLLGAIRRYDPKKYKYFTTFGYTRAFGECVDLLRRVLPNSRAGGKCYGEIKRAVTIYKQFEGRQPTKNELREAMYDYTDYHFTEAYNYWIGHEVNYLKEEDEQQNLPASLEDNPIVKLGTEDFLHYVLKKVTKDERIVLEMYFLDGFTLKEIGGIIGLSQSRVCQLLQASYTYLRRLYNETEIRATSRDSTEKRSG